MSESKSFAVIGAGPMGLMAALELLKRGHQVDIYEGDDRIGGMSAHFDFAGTRIERYYHFVCKTDQPLFDLLESLGISACLKWTDTRMGYFFDGRLYPWGTPLALFSFPHLGLVDKIRYALHVVATKSTRDWRKLDKVNAVQWLKKWLGRRCYRVLWERAFHLKFFEYAENLSAAWIGTRIKRVALSRRNLAHESLGFLEGGSETLLKEMVRAIEELGGRIHLKSRVQSVLTESSRVSAVVVDGDSRPYDSVISTIPIQYVPRMVPTLPAAFADQIRAIENIPVACVILKLKHQISDNFWTNISDPTIEIPGLIEYSNLNPATRDEHIVYAPFYMPKTHPKWAHTDESLIEEVIGYLGRINANFLRDWIIAQHCHRYEFAQTICPPGFFEMLPTMQTPIEGFLMADTSYYYPEDRSISESVAVGHRVALEALRH